MASNRKVPIIVSLVPFLLLLLVGLASARKHGAHGGGRATARVPFRAGEEREAYRRIMARMARMEKDCNKTIQANKSELPRFLPFFRSLLPVPAPSLLFASPWR